MIILVEKDEDKQHLMKICEKTPFGCKIISVAKAYGFDKGFACFWLDREQDVAFCLADGVMVLSGTVTNPKEISEFLRAVGPQSVMCAVRNAEALGLTVTDSGDVLKKQLEKKPRDSAAEEEINIREIFSLLEEAGMVEEFEPFYLDLSHKLRHGAAAAFTEYRGSELVGCGVVSSISDSAVILSALAVTPQWQGKGIGTGLVRRVEAAFPGASLYIFRDKEKNMNFYRKLGYAKTDTWVYSAVKEG